MTIVRAVLLVSAFYVLFLSGPLSGGLLLFGYLRAGDSDDWFDEHPVAERVYTVSSIVFSIVVVAALAGLFISLR